MVLFTFLCSGITTHSMPAHAEVLLDLPQPGDMVTLSPAYAPVSLKGMRVDPINALAFDFIVDTGNAKLNDKAPELRVESQKLIKYFLTALTVPEHDLWVNLSPYEHDRIIPNELGATAMGQDMLAQDYILKQVTASLMYPQDSLGRAFWSKVYSLAKQRVGGAGFLTQSPDKMRVNTFNKVWIKADKAKVYVHNNTAVVVASHLKVMLEEDYLAGQKNMSSNHSLVPVSTPEAPNDTRAIIKDLILPALEQEINEGQNFANLRQIFHAMILATWYKNNLKDALLNHVYANRQKMDGVATDDKTLNEKIYARYIQAYKKGVFNLIRDDIDSASHKVIPRKYFAGGLTDMAMATVVGPADDAVMAIKRGDQKWSQGDLLTVAVNMEGIRNHGLENRTDAAMLSQYFSFSHTDTSFMDEHLDNEIERQMKLPVLDSRRTFGLRSYMSVPTGRERGLSIGFDHSGSTNRAVLLYIDPDSGQQRVLSEVKEPFPKEILNAPAAQIFDYVAGRIKLLLEQASDETKALGLDMSSIPLGYAFGFAMRQSDLSKATFNPRDQGVKEWAFKDLHLKPINQWISEALQRNHLSNVHLTALFNDTVATQLSTSALAKDGTILTSRLAFIVGTGNNFSFVDPASNEVLDAESGNLDIPARLKRKEDNEYLNSLEPLQRGNRLEKLVTGPAIKELIRLRILNAFDRGTIFSTLPKETQDKYHKQLAQKGSLSWHDIRSINYDFPYQVNDHERELIISIIQDIYYRSAQILAYLIDKSLTLTDPDNRILISQGLFLPIDGGTFWFAKGYKGMVTKLLKRRRPDLEINFQQIGDTRPLYDLLKANSLVFVYVENASARGAAMGGLAAAQPKSTDAAMSMAGDVNQAMTSGRLVYTPQEYHALMNSFNNQYNAQMRLALNDPIRRFGRKTFMYGKNGQESGLGIGLDVTHKSIFYSFIYKDPVDGSESVINSGFVKAEEFNERTPYQQLFDELSSIVKRLMVTHADNLKAWLLDAAPVHLGVSFDFQMDQRGAASAMVDPKYFSKDQLRFQNVDLGRAMQTALVQRNLHNIKLEGVFDKTAAVQYSMSTYAGMATPMPRVALSASNRLNMTYTDPKTGDIINTRIRTLNIPQAFMREYDKQFLLARNRDLSHAIFEDFTSFASIAEIFRQRILDAVKNKQISKDIRDQVLRIFPKTDLNEPATLMNDFVTAVLTNKEALSRNLGESNVKALSALAVDISHRIQQLMSIVMMQGITLADPDGSILSKEGVVFPVNSGLTPMMPNFWNNVGRFIQDVHPDWKVIVLDDQKTDISEHALEPGTLKIIHIKSAGAIGAALGALTAAYTKEHKDRGMAAVGKSQEPTRAINPGDSAMNATRGGIDLNAQRMAMNVEGKAPVMNFDDAAVAAFRRGDFSGVRPVIISITPSAGFFELTGLPNPGLN